MQKTKNTTKINYNTNNTTTNITIKNKENNTKINTVPKTTSDTVNGEEEVKLLKLVITKTGFDRS